jgi:phosphatidylglycerol:prolipoprotein diacylglycerol transferase
LVGAAARCLFRPDVSRGAPITKQRAVAPDGVIMTTGPALSTARQVRSLTPCNRLPNVRASIATKGEAPRGSPVIHPMLAIPFPNFDPVAFSIGPVDVRWYGLSYMAGLLLGWLYIRRLLATPRLWSRDTAPFPPDRSDDLLLFMTAGVIIGGRLGHILLYQPSYYLQNPIQVFFVWQGGMAFHGALLGCGLAIWLFSRVYRVSVLSSMDVCAAAVPIGLFFGRLANFINGELFGRETTMPWGMIFPGVQQYLNEPGPEPRLALGWDPLAPRHPSQLYEAALEGLLLFLVIRWLTHHRNALKSPGTAVGTFLIGYGIARSVCELFFRQPDPFHPLTAYGLTPGAIYSLPMIALGLVFLAVARRGRTTVATEG